MVLSTGVGGAIQMALFLIAAAITATAVDTSSSSDSSGSTTLIVIAVVAALIGIVLFVPKIRGKVVPAVKQAALDIWTVLRNPKKALQLFGGDTAGNLIYPALLGLCLLAFHQRLDFAQLVVVQVGAGMVGNVAPVPGGIGVQEAALTGGLTAFGIPAAPALATVLVFRGITFAIPPDLRVLHPALAARQGLRVGRGRAAVAARELRPSSRSCSTRSSPPRARSRSASTLVVLGETAAAAWNGLAFGIGVVLGQAVASAASPTRSASATLPGVGQRTRDARAAARAGAAASRCWSAAARVAADRRYRAAEAELAVQGGARPAPAPQPALGVRRRRGRPRCRRPEAPRAHRAGRRDHLRRRPGRGRGRRSLSVTGTSWSPPCS